jgi:hypothetical protein
MRRDPAREASPTVEANLPVEASPPVEAPTDGALETRTF